MSATLYPKGFSDFLKFHRDNSGGVAVLPTPVFWYGMAVGQEFELELEPEVAAHFQPVSPSTEESKADGEADNGALQSVSVKLLSVGPRQGDDMTRSVKFEVNGVLCAHSISDKPQDDGEIGGPRADPSDPRQLASPMLGVVETIHVEEGAALEKGQMVLTITAMKMEVHVTANVAGVLGKLEVTVGDKVAEGSLLGVVE